MSSRVVVTEQLSSDTKKDMPISENFRVVELDVGQEVSLSKTLIRTGLSEPGVSGPFLILHVWVDASMTETFYRIFKSINKRFCKLGLLIRNEPVIIVVDCKNNRSTKWFMIGEKFLENRSIEFADIGIPCNLWIPMCPDFLPFQMKGQQESCCQRGHPFAAAAVANENATLRWEVDCCSTASCQRNCCMYACMFPWCFCIPAIVRCATAQSGNIALQTTELDGYYLAGDFAEKVIVKRQSAQDAPDIYASTSTGSNQI